MQGGLGGMKVVIQPRTIQSTATDYHDDALV